MSDSVLPHRRQPTRLLCPWDSPGKNTRVGCHFLLQCMKVKSEREFAQSCPTLSDPMDSSPPGSSTHGIFQARVLEWGAIAFYASQYINTQVEKSPSMNIYMYWCFASMISLFQIDLVALAAWRSQWQPTPVLLPGKSHGLRSLVGCSPWGR